MYHLPVYGQRLMKINNLPESISLCYYSHGSIDQAVHLLPKHLTPLCLHAGSCPPSTKALDSHVFTCRKLSTFYQSTWLPCVYMQESNKEACCTTLSNGLRYAKRSIMSWVVVIPKEALAWPLFLVWHWLSPPKKKPKNKQTDRKLKL